MRLVRLLVVFLVLLGNPAESWTAEIPSASSSRESKRPTPATPNLQEAKRHLKLGVALYQEHNYGAALAEFEASFRAHPTAAALQNVALCQMKLFRYVQALKTIERTQRQFVDELSDEDWAALQRAKSNMEALIGRVTMNVTQPDAKVSIDGKVVPRRQLVHPLPLAAGLYTFRVSAPNHVSEEREVEIAGGDQLHLTFSLVPTDARVTIRAGSPNAHITLNGHTVGKGSWRGKLPEGSHRVVVSLPGYEAGERWFEVRGGKALSVEVPLGPPTDALAREDSSASDTHEVVSVDMSRGWFASTDAAYFMVLEHPDDFRPDSDADTTASTFGLRGGYRLDDHFAVMGFAETGTHRVRGIYQRSTQTHYALTSIRFGGGIQWMLGTRRTRLATTLLVGAIHHDLTLDQANFSGFNGAVRLEVGPQFSIGHVLVDVNLRGAVEGANNALFADHSAYSEHTMIPMMGIGFRIGYSQWAGP